MEETVNSFLNMVGVGDYEGTTRLLDDILADGYVSSFSKLLERHVEELDTFNQFQLRVRDSLMIYLNCPAFYFALQVPSYQLLQVVSDQYDRNAASNRMSEFIQLLNSQNNPTLDLSFVEVESLKATSFVVLIPDLLSKRESELSLCKIYKSAAKKQRFSISELLHTHYGRKIAAACDINPQHPVVGENDFTTLKETFLSFDLDLDDLLTDISEEEWYEHANNESRILGGGELKSRELQGLHKTAIDRLKLASGKPSIVGRALYDISKTKTRFCNDAVVRIATVGSESLRVEAVRLLEGSNDMAQIEFLSSMIRNSSGDLRTALANAVSSLSSSPFTRSISLSSDKEEEAPIIVEAPPNLLMVYNQIMNRIQNSRVPHIRIDAIKSLVTFNIPDVEKDLQKLMFDSDPLIRIAVLGLAEDLPKNQAQEIISIALKDDIPDVVKKATAILETRWPDDYW